MDTQYAARYEQLHREHWWWQARGEIVCKTIDSLNLPKPTRILDVGCGGGWAFHQWRRYGEVWGVEIDSTLVARAGEHQSRIHSGPFDRSFKSPCSYSLILMLDVLEHLEQPRDALLYAKELLEPGGKIILTVPAMPSAWTSHDVLNHHFRRYTHRALEELVRDSGMRIHELRYFYHWTAPIKWIIRLKEMCRPVGPQPPRVPIRPFNDAFHKLSLIEWHILRSLRLPFGTSLLCVGSYAAP